MAELERKTVKLDPLQRRIPGLEEMYREAGWEISYIDLTTGQKMRRALRCSGLQIARRLRQVKSGLPF